MIRVVIAEDESIIRLDLRETLQEEGYEVLGETGRGDEALELVRRLRPDLVILDVKMPGLDGIEAARRIGQERLAAVLILTAFSQRELVEQAVHAGVMAYLVKPFQRSELVPAIELALGRFRDLRALTEEVHELEDRLETRKVLDRAKALLMARHGMTEAAAFAFLQRGAMDARTTMRALADQVLAGERAPEQ